MTNTETVETPNGATIDKLADAIDNAHNDGRDFTNSSRYTNWDELTLKVIPIEEITVVPILLGRDDDGKRSKEEITGKAASIRAGGQRQPATVAINDNFEYADLGRLVLLAGGGRFAAIRQIEDERLRGVDPGNAPIVDDGTGRVGLLCQISRVSLLTKDESGIDLQKADAKALLTSLHENLNVLRPTAIQSGRNFKRLQSPPYNMKQTEIAAELGVKKFVVSTHTSLVTNLTEHTQRQVHDGKLSVGAALELITSGKTPEQIEAIADKMIAEAEATTGKARAGKKQAKKTVRETGGKVTKSGKAKKSRVSDGDVMQWLEEMTGPGAPVEVRGIAAAVLSVRAGEITTDEGQKAMVGAVRAFAKGKAGGKAPGKPKAA